MQRQRSEIFNHLTAINDLGLIIKSIEGHNISILRLHESLEELSSEKVVKGYAEEEETVDEKEDIAELVHQVVHNALL